MQSEEKLLRTQKNKKVVNLEQFVTTCAAVITQCFNIFTLSRLKNSNFVQLGPKVCIQIFKDEERGRQTISTIENYIKLKLMFAI